MTDAAVRAVGADAAIWFWPVYIYAAWARGCKPGDLELSENAFSRALGRQRETIFDRGSAICQLGWLRTRPPRPVRWSLVSRRLLYGDLPKAFPFHVRRVMGVGELFERPCSSYREHRNVTAFFAVFSSILLLVGTEKL